MTLAEDLREQVKLRAVELRLRNFDTMTDEEAEALAVQEITARPLFRMFWTPVSAAQIKADAGKLMALLTAPVQRLVKSDESTPRQAAPTPAPTPRPVQTPRPRTPTPTPAAQSTSTPTQSTPLLYIGGGRTRSAAIRLDSDFANDHRFASDATANWQRDQKRSWR
jgi:hypothetical protein